MPGLDIHPAPYKSEWTDVAGKRSWAWARMQGAVCEAMVWEREIAEWTLGDVTRYDTVSDGNLHWYNFTDPNTGKPLTNFPAGQYFVKYCSGAWLDAPGLWAVTAQQPSQPQLNGGHRIVVQYNLNGVPTQAIFNEGAQCYSNYAQAIGANLGGATARGITTPLFSHSGGNIQMGFIDLNEADNANAWQPEGSPRQTEYINPTFMLAQAVFTVLAGRCFATYTQAGSPRWTGQFTFINPTVLAQNVTFKMRDVAGRITNPSSPTVNIGALFNAFVPITFDCPGPQCDPIIEAWWGGVKQQEFQFHLAAVINWTGANLYAYNLGCGNTYNINYSLSNVGNMDTSPGCKFEFKANFLQNPKLYPSCAPQDYQVYQLHCQDGGTPWNFTSIICYNYVTPRPSGQVECVVTDGDSTLLDQTINVS